MSGISVTTTFAPMDRRLNAFARGIKDPSKPLMQFATWYGADVWRALDRHTFGSDYDRWTTFRGRPWPPILPQYVRKTGPVQDRRVPPWGGVERIAGEILWNASDVATGKKLYARADKVYGRVKGKLRPSDTRVKTSSFVGRDTNEMFRQFARNPALSGDRKIVTLSTNRPQAARFHKKRPFAFVTSADQNMLRQFCLLWLREQIVRTR